MTKPIQYALLAAALTMCGLCVWGGMGLTRHAIETLDAWKQAAPDLKPTLDAISGPRGTLWQANKAIVKIGDAVVTTQIQQRKIAPHVIASVDSLASIAPHVNPMIDEAKGTLAAGTELTQEATATMRTLNDGAGPLLAAYTRSGDDLDALLKSHAIHATLDNLQSVIGSLAHITNDGQRVADDATAKYFKPTPWYRKTLPYATTGAKIAAYALPWP